MTSAVTIDHAAELLDRLRARRPLVQNITNYVAMAVSANVLLALGASPAMVHATDEVEEFTAIADALVINIGTLSAPWIEAMRIAARSAGLHGKPWVLDPVATGATSLRTRTATELLALRPTILRGNAGEILSLAGSSGAAMKGVDSLAGSDAAIAAARALASASGAVVVVTGKTDYATDGSRLIAVEGGHELMPLSTALGCALSATVAAFAAVAPPLEAAVAALAVYGAAGAEAGSRSPDGPGHLPAELCNALYRMDAALLARYAAIREMT